MAHESERTFHEKVLEYLEGVYGEENVETNKYLSEARRYCDVWVETQLGILAIEIENDFEACFKGVGQAIVYAAHHEEAMPMIIVPEDHVEEPERSMLARHVPIAELDL